MAVTGAAVVDGPGVGGSGVGGPGGDGPDRRTGLGLGIFARLKLRVLRNGMRGQTWRVILFVFGVLGGLYLAGLGFLLFSFSGQASDRWSALVPVFGGALLVFAWLIVPLVWTGVDETLDPARFALLPLPRRTLVAGLLVAALLGIPAAVTLIASAGLLVGTTRLGGLGATVVEGVGVIIGLLICVSVSRAVTSAFASLLRARRTRDLAAVALALMAALLGPIQIGILATARRAEVDDLLGIADVLGWTPLAAPYLAGFDVAHGRPGTAAARLAIGVATVGLLLWWWSRTLESAMVGGSGGVARVRGIAGGAVAQLFPKVLGSMPRTRDGALVAREVRYWWRDARRRASLVTIAAVGIFVPLVINVGATGLISGEGRTPASPVMVTITMLMIGSLAAVSLANQFGYDGTAYAAHLTVGIPGRVELRSRLVAFSIYIVPLFLVVTTVVAVVLRQPGHLPAMLGGLIAVYGAGLAVNTFVSIFGAYALPETSNPFAVSTGAGLAKSLYAIVGMVGAVLAAAPIGLLALLAGGFWSLLVLPLGVAYGVGAAALGVYIAGDVLDRRAPELLGMVTPRR